jgi:anti-sigma regulatory factor (Ser/Thr protein kinase)
MNVVVHAYSDGEPGLLEVEAAADSTALTVVVRDFGAGIRPRADIGRPSLRIGLTLIAALASSFEIRGGADRGTEIRMDLPLQARDEAVDGELAAELSVIPIETTEMRVGRAELLGPVLSRALSALAARREITIDRLSDTMLLSDAISAAAPAVFGDGRVCLSIADRDEGVELRVGPMRSGGGEKLRASLDLPEVGGSLEALADELRVERDEEGEFLVVGVASLAA